MVFTVLKSNFGSIVLYMVYPHTKYTKKTHMYIQL